MRAPGLPRSTYALMILAAVQPNTIPPATRATGGRQFLTTNQRMIAPVGSANTIPACCMAHMGHSICLGRSFITRKRLTSHPGNDRSAMAVAMTSTTSDMRIRDVSNLHLRTHTIGSGAWLACTVAWLSLSTGPRHLPSQATSCQSIGDCPF